MVRDAGRDLNAEMLFHEPASHYEEPAGWGGGRWNALAGLFENLVCASLFLPVALTAGSLAGRLDEAGLCEGVELARLATLLLFLLFAIGGLFAVVVSGVMVRAERAWPSWAMVWVGILAIGFLGSVVTLQSRCPKIMCASFAASVIFSLASVFVMDRSLWRATGRELILAGALGIVLLLLLVVFERAWR